MDAPAKDTIDCLQSIKDIGSFYQEGWGNIELQISYRQEIFLLLKNLYNTLSSTGHEVLVKFWFDNEEVTISEFDEYEANPNSFELAKLYFNKSGLLERASGRTFFRNFFLTSDSCEKWITPLDPLDERNPINRFSPLLIYVPELSETIGSDTLILTPVFDHQDAFPAKTLPQLPSFKKLQESIHFISDTKVAFDPNTYSLKQANYDGALPQALLKQSGLALSICIVDEFYTVDKVILNGLKRLMLKVIDSQEVYNIDFICQLQELVLWIYEDRVSTRKKLFNERLTLEIDDSDSLIHSLRLFLKVSLDQAKERYNFVIIDRKDAYVKELKDLLKDLRAQSDLYSLKIRNLLNNFLRDLLAALVLIGFTIFTKFSDNIGLNKHHLITYVFDALAVYFIISIVFQSIVDVTDLKITNKELLYWKRASKELISEKEFDTHYQNSLNSRKTSIYLLYPLIGLLYLGLSILCHYYPFFFDTLIINP